jgi:hypothetical protein
MNPDWWQVVLTVAAGLIAWRAFRSEREAVRLTQRADVLLDSIDVRPANDPPSIWPNTEVQLHFRNYGPTRANDVRFSIDLTIAGAMKKEASQNGPLLPPIVIAANENSPASFPLLGQMFEAEDIKRASRGDAEMRFTATATYVDVFGKRHRSHYTGIYYGQPPVAVFVVDTQQCD